MEEAFDIFNGRDILELMTLTVIEDRERLDSSSMAAIRERFRQWCTTAPQSEQQQGDAASEIGPGASPRYRYAIQVDAASLHSVVYDAPAPPSPDLTKKGWVRLINSRWQLTSSELIRDSFEPVEGVTEKNMGWMKVPYQHAMGEYYVRGRDLNWWVTSYRRPPVVMGYPFDG